MRQTLMSIIRSDERLHLFIRRNPSWYRRLSRDPLEFENFKREAGRFSRMSWPEKIFQFSNGLQMAQMMFALFWPTDAGGKGQEPR
ncbi:MAG: hypothetical protein C6P37_05465 [Caldibacillus debilis]|uniref:YlbE-like protein n=1 Tax=Caldibacillus debilis TaxID=301148 RepID=A0A150LQ08_9BACI|nr:YlbE-like family protein [Caldibacillus debilis]MBO2480544.1 hypothetical protein [Bacillaceae bacterium]KYD14341.1 hypothetical protein B4135_2768 [Caldibacillus debilis]MBY6271430.1 hypothetical protein [Bacillaceae bacterium]OUM88482.1 MAG: hypothetical protein BAA03_01370 [Caldibacillus debilis]REJ26841.1 MAG: hypothetical protein C6W56_11470 [Caldibacillus debilis]